VPFQERLAGWLKKFGQTLWFRVLYLALISLVVTALFPYTFSGSTACLILLLMPVTMFVIPYWIGERRNRRFIENGLIIFVIAVLAISAFQTSTVLGADPVELQSVSDPLLDPTLHLANGTVAPFHASEPTTYSFRVFFTSDKGGPPADYSVYANLTIIDGLSQSQRDFQLFAESSNDTKNGTWYNTSISLGTSIYGFGFFVHDRSGNWTATGSVLGPIAAPWPSYYGFFAYYTTLLLLIPLVFYFLIMFMWWYSARARRTRARMAEMASAKESKPTTMVEKAAKAAAFTCTNCGADVSEDDAKCPKCGAVFED